MNTPEDDLPYTILTKVPGKPQLLKLAPVQPVDVPVSADKFTLRQGRWLCLKEPAVDAIYRLDLSGVLTEKATTVAAVLATTTQGVFTTAPASVNGMEVSVRLAGLDTTEGALNFCRFRLKCANSEEFEATMWFEGYEG